MHYDITNIRWKTGWIVIQITGVYTIFTGLLNRCYSALYKICSKTEKTVT